MLPIDMNNATPSLTDKINKVTLDERELPRGSLSGVAGSEAGSSAGNFYIAQDNMQQRQGPHGWLIPNFLEMDDEPLDKLATRHQ
jgi:hypothetical protein